MPLSPQATRILAFGSLQCLDSFLARPNISSMGPRVNQWLSALAGLSVLLACSPAPAPLEEHPKPAVEARTALPSRSAGFARIEEQARPAVVESIGQAPDAEAQAILQEFPALRRRYRGEKTDDGPVGVFRLGRVAAAELKAAFPGVRFYRGVHAQNPPGVYGSRFYLLAVTRDSFYDMPDGFNLLLFATGRRLTDSNVVAMARAFVLLYAVGTADSAGMLPIAILNAKRALASDSPGVAPDSSGVFVRFSVGCEVRELWVGDRHGQFRSLVETNLHIDEDRKKPGGLDGTIEVIGYILSPPWPALEEPRGFRRQDP
jgi:hypothetical protein